MNEKKEVLIEECATAIAVILHAATPLIIGLTSLTCGTFLMIKALELKEEYRYSISSNAAMALFGAGGAGTLGAIHPGIKSYKRKKEQE